MVLLAIIPSYPVSLYIYVARPFLTHCAASFNVPSMSSSEGLLAGELRLWHDVFGLVLADRPRHVSVRECETRAAVKGGGRQPGVTYFVWLPRAESWPFSFQNWTRVKASVLPT